MMRVFTTLFVAVALAGGALFAQEPEPVPFEPDYTFSGLSGGVWRIGLSPLNEALERAGYPALPPFAFCYGQESIVGLIDGPRLGISVGYGRTASRVEARRAELRVTLGAGVVEWGVPRGSNASIAFGFALGAGTSVLTLVDHRPETFDEALAIPFRSKMDGWLYTVEPSVSAGGTPLPGLDLKLRVGYRFAFGCSWRAEAAPLDRPIDALAGPVLRASFQIAAEELLAATTGDEEAGRPE